MGAPPEVTPALRLVLDTNVVVSALVFRGGRLSWLRDAWAGTGIVPLVSAETLAELIRVLAYPRFRLSVDEQKSAVTHYMQRAEAIKSPRTRARIPACRDPKDEMFLRLAYAAKADALVTGDADLLVLAGQSRIAIIEPSELRQMTGGT